MMKHSLFLALIWCAALVLCASCVIRHVRGTNGNLGVWLTDGLAAGLLVYAVWHEPIHRFCSHGVGRVLAILFGCGMALFVCLLAFVAVSGYSDQPKGEKKAVIVLGAGLRGERITSLPSVGWMRRMRIGWIIRRRCWWSPAGKAPVRLFRRARP